MIYDLISSIISTLIAITILLWLPTITLKSLHNNKKFKNLILLLEDLNRGIKIIWNYCFFILGLILKGLFSAFVGINIRPMIYYINSPLGEGYALWASYIIAALTFYILPDFFKLPSKKKWVD